MPSKGGVRSTPSAPTMHTLSTHLARVRARVRVRIRLRARARARARVRAEHARLRHD